MNNFARVIRLSLRYKWTFAASIPCALMVGLLWCANIGAVLPFVEVLFSGHTADTYIAEKISESEAISLKAEQEILSLQEQLATADPTKKDRVENQIRLAQSKIDSEQQAIERYRWAAPYLTRFMPGTPMATLTMVCAFILIGTVIKGVFIICQSLLAARLAQRGSLVLRNRFFRKSLHMDVGMFSREGVADLMSRFTNDMNAVSSGLNILFGKMIREPLKLIVCLIGAAVISWRLLLFTMILLPVAGLAIKWLARMLKRANRRAMEETSLIYARLEESFRAIRIIKAFTLEARLRARFMDQAKSLYRKSMKIAGYDSLAHPMTEVLGFVMICMALGAGAYLVVKGETHIFGIRMCYGHISSEMLILFYGCLFGAADPARKMSGIFSQVQQAAAASDRIYEMMDRIPEVKDVAHPKRLPKHHRSIEFERIGFAYDNGLEVLHDVSLRIPFGETVAIVGPSGCGKSTLTSLVPRFADPTSGRLMIDGIPLNEARLRDLRNQVGLVTQEPMLFNDSVLENIRFGRPHATDAEVVEAAKVAHAHDFILNQLNDGYETIVGPMGGQLSGGQRQRISLARAILRDPKILILDEATSQIDMQSEQIIHRVLAEFVKHRTTIIVTHRPGALQLADRIVVMEDGRISAIGDHEHLIRTSEYYGSLFQTRKSA